MKYALDDGPDQEPDEVVKGFPEENARYERLRQGVLNAMPALPEHILREATLLNYLEGRDWDPETQLGFSIKEDEVNA